MTQQASTAAYVLEGQTIGDGWLVGARFANPRIDRNIDPEKSGSTFSVGYKVTKTGREAFLKVFDILSAFLPGGNFLVELNRITSSYQHEKAILDLCATGRMSRIVRILDHGDIPVPFPVPGNPEFVIRLHFIIFVRADGGDIRDIFARFDQVTDAAKFQYLHHVAVGLQQLHGARISHQDLKPSNVVVFEMGEIGAKITDFGRALKRGETAAHEAYSIAGDPIYAPPEQLYDHRASDWRERREASDLFQLGSLAAFMFSGKNATAGIMEFLPPDARPGNWGGTYQDILPVVQRAFADFLASIRPSFPDWAIDDVQRLITLACEPDVYKRGDPRARAQVNQPLGIDRFISRLQELFAEARRRLLVAGRRETT